MTVYVAVHVADSPGANANASWAPVPLFTVLPDAYAHEPHVKSAPVPENTVSSISTPLNDTFPPLVTRNEYVTDAPAPDTESGDTDFSNVILGAALIVTVASSVSVTADPVGGVPDAVAVLSTAPWSASACVTVYVAVHFADSPGANANASWAPVPLFTVLPDAYSHDTHAKSVPVPENVVSTTFTPCNDTFPSLLIRKEYVTDAPACDTESGDTDFAKAILGAAAIVTVASSVSVTTDPVGGVPDTVAMLSTELRSTSACVTVYVAVHVTDSPGANARSSCRSTVPLFTVLAGAYTHDTHVKSVPVPVNVVSATSTPLNDTFPSFVTRKEYVTDTPASDTESGDTDFSNAILGAALIVTSAVSVSDTADPVGGVPDTVAVLSTTP